jgi:hypothetical protein
MYPSLVIEFVQTSPPSRSSPRPSSLVLCVALSPQAPRSAVIPLGSLLLPPILVPSPLGSPPVTNITVTVTGLAPKREAVILISHYQVRKEGPKGFKLPLHNALSLAVCLIDGTGMSIDCISLDEWVNLRYKYPATFACLWRRTRFSRDNVKRVFTITRS